MVSKWVTEERVEVAKSFIFKHFQVRRKSPDSGAVGTFDTIKCFDWVNMIPLTAEGEVVMVKQYRHGSDSVTLEIPGGAVDPGEDFLTAAKRELQEECAYTGEQWTKVGQVQPNPAFIENTCETYLVENCRPNGTQDLDPKEEIDVVKVPLKEIPKLIADGTIQHSLVIAAFYHLANK